MTPETDDAGQIESERGLSAEGAARDGKRVGVQRGHCDYKRNNTRGNDNNATRRDQHEGTRGGRQMTAGAPRASDKRNDAG